MKQENNTEKQILAAAEEEFMGKGFAGARTTSIAEAAGVTHAMLHYYFRTKEQLFGKVLAMKMSEALNSIVSALEQSSGRDIVERICGAAVAHYDFLSSRPTLPLFVLNEVIAQPERLGLYSKLVPEKMLPALAPYIKDVGLAVKEGKISPIKPIDLLTDIAVLNLGTVLAKPLITALTGQSGDDYDRTRREENVGIIKKRLLP